MKTKTSKRRLAETAVGAAVGGVIAGPIGAVAGALAASHVEEGLKHIAQLKPPEDPRKIAADDPLVHAHLKRILVPLDFSPPSKRAVRFAREWAALFGAEVFLLHVIEPPSRASGAYGIGISSAGASRRDISGQAAAALRYLARTEFPGSFPVSVIVRKGKPFEQIAAAAQDIHADIVIIATHGYTGLKRVLIGSTTERVARHAPCPVLVLRRRQRA